jgi:hypothetical protein
MCFSLQSAAVYSMVSNNSCQQSGELIDLSICKTPHATDILQNDFEEIQVIKIMYFFVAED